VQLSAFRDRQRDQTGQQRGSGGANVNRQQHEHGFSSRTACV
jgi:hypothetical protein